MMFLLSILKIIKKIGNYGIAKGNYTPYFPSCPAQKKLYKRAILVNNPHKYTTNFVTIKPYEKKPVFTPRLFP
jgi:hypothetical protein